tara:strand:- start:1431 stop:2453 length:1023 start_codon:yes stop_codon:yes gene_type:complete
MKLTWTIGMHPRAIDMNAFIKTVQEQRGVTSSQLRMLDEHVARIDMSPCLRKLWDALLVLAHARPSCLRTTSSLVEFVAGIDYAATAAHIGRLQTLRSSYALAGESNILTDLRNFAADALKRKRYRRPDMWFELRVRAMDAHALCIACASRDTLIIYYAGRKHTKYFSDHMIRLQGATKEAPSHRVLREMPTASLSGLEQLQWREKTILLLGENHDMTHVSFAEALLELLKHQCNRDLPCTFMIERHPGNASDHLQQHLTCNMPNIALHRARCASFFETEKDACARLSVHFVDTRHVDCGFLRREILDAWYVGTDFRRKAQRFQKRALRSVIHFVDDCLQ